MPEESMTGVFPRKEEGEKKVEVRERGTVDFGGPPRGEGPSLWEEYYRKLMAGVGTAIGGPVAGGLLGLDWEQLLGTPPELGEEDGIEGEQRVEERPTVAAVTIKDETSRATERQLKAKRRVRLPWRDDPAGMPISDFILGKCPPARVFENAIVPPDALERAKRGLEAKYDTALEELRSAAETVYKPVRALEALEAAAPAAEREYERLAEASREEIEAINRNAPPQTVDVRTGRAPKTGYERALERAVTKTLRIYQSTQDLRYTMRSERASVKARLDTAIESISHYFSYYHILARDLGKDPRVGSVGRQLCWLKLQLEFMKVLADDARYAHRALLAAETETSRRDEEWFMRWWAPLEREAENFLKWMDDLASAEWMDDVLGPRQAPPYDRDGPMRFARARAIQVANSSPPWSTTRDMPDDTVHAAHAAAVKEHGRDVSLFLKDTENIESELAWQNTAAEVAFTVAGIAAEAIGARIMGGIFGKTPPRGALDVVDDTPGPAAGRGIRGSPGNGAMGGAPGVSSTQRALGMSDATNGRFGGRGLLGHVENGRAAMPSRGRWDPAQAGVGERRIDGIGQGHPTRPGEVEPGAMGGSRRTPEPAAVGQSGHSAHTSSRGAGDGPRGTSDGVNQTQPAKGGGERASAEPPKREGTTGDRGGDRGRTEARPSDEAPRRSEGEASAPGVQRRQGVAGGRRGGSLKLARGGSRLDADEIATGRRLAQQMGRDLSESAHIGAEFVDDLGRTYDACGKPAASRFWNERKFLKSVDSHLLKSNDFTAVDLTGFTEAQKAVVRAYIDGLPAASQARIIRIGF